MSKKPGLKLVPSDRRARARQSIPSPESKVLWDDDSVAGELCGFDFGRITVRMSANCDLDSLGSGITKDLVVIKDGLKIVTGDWKVISHREESGIRYVSFEHPQLATLQKFSDHLDSEVLLRKSRIRIMDFSSTKDLNEVSRHYTELKDFSRPIRCRIYASGNSLDATFNFESGKKDLETIDFEVGDGMDGLSVGSAVVVEYTFLSARYLFSGLIEGLDKDFSVVSVKFERELLSVTARKFDRMSCNLGVGIRYEGISEARACVMTNISPTGCEIETSEVASVMVGQKFTLCPSGGLREVVAFVRGIDKRSVRASFDSSQSQQEAIRDLYNLAVSPPLCIRKTENYDAIIDLYKGVGYSTENTADLNAWVELTKKSWLIQDEVMPGNTVGVFDGAEAVSSFSVVPLSSMMVYGHSLAMKKTAASIGNFPDMCLQNLFWVDFLPGIESYCGSARVKSSFATRLHTVFEAHASPESIQLFNCLVVLPGTNGQPQSRTKYILKSSTEACPDGLSPEVVKLIKRISTPNELTSKYHEIRSYDVIDSERSGVVARIVAHRSIPFFTAANILRCAWVFSCDQSLDLGALYNQMQQDDFLRELEVDFFLHDVGKMPERLAVEAEQEEVFWYYVDKDDLGPLLVSVNRAAYSVLRKYGADAEEYLKKMAS